MPRDTDRLATLWGQAVGQIYLLQTLSFFCQGDGRGVSRHQKVSKAITGAEKLLAKGGLNAGKRTEPVHSEECASEAAAFGLDELD
jgi:hypothetical protein